jgi:small-conductance mechanosensitive channel
MGIWLQAGWNYELLAVEDSIQVEGETITGKRSITVGKVIRAIAILVFGYWLSRWLSYRVEALAVARFGLDPNRARIARRWTETLGLFALVIFALIWVQIPLTVFAFLGGAIAIGLGFGMQNALKNLISGLMILFERPFRPGDLIEVGTIRGRVTEIGVRSSVVRNSQGIETLIPNSTLVEQNLTNWTYSTPVVRFEIRIGVAYGSPSRRIAEILVAVAHGHPSVLASPEPRVVFEDFGADALMFSLDFWVEVKPGVEARVVASDLRHLIGEALAEAGITIAFPQRDIHLDAARPLSVQLVKASV